MHLPEGVRKLRNPGAEPLSEIANRNALQTLFLAATNDTASRGVELMRRDREHLQSLKELLKSVVEFQELQQRLAALDT